MVRTIIMVHALLYVHTHCQCVTHCHLCTHMCIQCDANKCVADALSAVSHTHVTIPDICKKIDNHTHQMWISNAHQMVVDATTHQCIAMQQRTSNVGGFNNAPVHTKCGCNNTPVHNKGMSLTRPSRLSSSRIGGWVPVMSDESATSDE